MILRTALITCLALAAAPALALDIPNPSRSDSRVRSVSYNEWDVVRVVGTLRTSVQIVFAQTEEIIDVGSGDTVAWEIVPRGNILYLKPREANPPTTAGTIRPPNKMTKQQKTVSTRFSGAGRMSP